MGGVWSRVDGAERDRICELRASGRTVAAQCLVNVQCIGSWADIHVACGLRGDATFSVAPWHSNATVNGSRFQSARTPLFQPSDL